MKTKLILLLLLIVMVNSCYVPSNLRTVVFSSVNNNVCKRLDGDIVLYAIFVDSKFTNPWSKYDIETTLDSIRVATEWIEQKALEDSVDVHIQVAYHKTLQGRVPIKNDFSKKTLSGTLYKKPLWSGVRDIYKWADKIAKEAGLSMPRDTSPITNIKNDLKNRERLIARLRDHYQTDHVALMYFINNYYSDEISATFDISNDNNVEFSIVSFKNPSVIAHEFLHLFGAYDLYLTQYDVKKRDKKKKDKLMEMFPNEVMAFAHRNLSSLNISDFTKYLIGWKKEMPVEYQRLLLKKGYFTAKY
ncbi:MAG: hypothetical protein JXA72_08765 [Bacteroidales bacterium]|nr:hypothetical protein [Bacteroidales bacterium]